MAHRLHVISYGSKGFISIVPKMMTEVIGTDSQEVIEDSENLKLNLKLNLRLKKEAQSKR